MGHFVLQAEYTTYNIKKICLENFSFLLYLVTKYFLDLLFYLGKLRTFQRNKHVHMKQKLIAVQGIDMGLFSLMFVHSIRMLSNPGVIMDTRVVLFKCLSLFLLFKFPINILQYQNEGRDQIFLIFAFPLCSTVPEILNK